MEPFDVKKPDVELSCYLDFQGVIQVGVRGNVSSDHEEDLRGWSDAIKTAMRLAKKKDPNRVFCIIDMTGPKVDMDHKSLRMLIELVRHNRDYATRTGVYGPNIITASIIDVALKATGRTNMKVFFTRAEAEHWVFTGKVKKEV